MINQRFTIQNGRVIKDNQKSANEHGYVFSYKSDADEVCELLNELYNENRFLRLELDTHKHPLWSTREAERIVNELKQENKQLKEIIEGNKLIYYYKE